MAFYVLQRIRSQRAWQRVQLLPEPRFVTNGAKVGPKFVSLRRKCFKFLRELLKLAFVSTWNYMKWFI